MLDILEETFQLYLQWNFPVKQIIQQCPIFVFFFFGYFLLLHKLFGNCGISQQSNSLNNTLQKSGSNMFWLCATLSSFDCSHICFFIQIDCYLCIHSGNSSGSINDTCGPKSHMTDVLCWLLCITKENLQNHIPKGIWDTMEGDDVAFVSQFMARDNGSDEKSLTSNESNSQS